MRPPSDSVPADPRIPSASPPPIRPATLVLLLGLSLLLVFLALEPFLSYALFGSDTGEYYALTAALTSTGAIPHGAAYHGWGAAYPDFPGIYLLAGAGAGALGLSPLTALTTIIPIVAVLSVLPLFLLFRRLYPNDTVALLAASVAALAMPRLFSIAHPAPLALGDFLSVAALWMFVESRRDTRWFLPLALTGGALIVTHHLSTFFFVVGAAGGVLFLELWHPRLWSLRFPTRELGFLAGFVTATFVFWFYGTYSFVNKVLSPALAQSSVAGFGAFEAAGVGGVVLVGLLIWVRRRSWHPRRIWVRLPSDRSVVRDAALLTVVIFGGIALLLVGHLPGTTQSTTPAAILWFSPVLGVGLLCAGSRRALTMGRLGPFALAWVGAVGLAAALALLGSALGGSVANYTQAIPASRAVEYILIPVGLLVAVGTARLVARAGERGGRRALLAASLGVVLLLAANGAIVYPPQADFGGFQEGLTHGDAAVWMWVGIAVPQGWTVATDHRLSSMIFGFDGNPSTWTTTPGLFVGHNVSTALAELRSSGVPDTRHPRAIDLVAVDSVMYGGVALDPSAQALPLSPEAIAWLGGLPFVPLYEDGPNVVYLVDFTYVPPG